MSLVDRWVGRLLDKVSDLRLLDNTVVMLTTDHGFLHGEHGIIGKSLIDKGITYIPLYEEINHIPFIVSVPGVAVARTDALVQPMDIMPTILDMAGVRIPDTVHGSSFRKVLERETDTHLDVAFSTPYVGVVEPPVTVVHRKWSAVIYPRKTGQTGQVDRAVDGMSKEQAFDAERLSEDLLFDISSDPGQQRSVASDHCDIVEDARKAFVGYLERIGTAENLVARWRNQ